MKRLFFTLMIIVFSTVSIAQQTPEQIKDILKKLERSEQVDDNFYDTVYICLESQIKSSTGVNRAIWHSCMAEFLGTYLRQNQYSILQRTAIAGDKNPDFKTWDIQLLVKETIYNYLKSLENKDLLQKTDIKVYKILLDDTSRSIEYRPTVYDFLAFRALDYLSQPINQMPIPIVPFEINEPNYFADNSTFAGMNITTPDSISFQYLSLTLMQELTAFHLASKLTFPLIDVALRRLTYVKENSKLAEKEELFLNNLQLMEKQYQNQPGYEDIAYAIGRYYQERASQYDVQLHPDYQWDYVSAIQWFEKCLAFAPKSMAGKNAKSYITQIKAKEITLSLPSQIASDHPTLMTFQYKNCDSLCLRIIPVNSIKEIENVGMNRLELLKMLLKKKYLHQFTIKAVNHNDYQSKTGDGILPGLEIGNYCILVTPSVFDVNREIEGYSTSFVEVTNINVSYRKNNNEYQFFVFDRTTGQPLKNATLTFTLKEYDNKTYHTSTTKTNENGLAFFTYGSKNSYYYLDAKVEYGKELYYVNGLYLYNSNYETGKTKYVTFFTDRAIYRPGQTVYYKGIVIEYSSKENKVVPNESGKVVFYDHNRQLITTNDFLTNEFGSFSGSFIIPESGLNGTYTIQALNSNFRISVEEYKRPQFEITVDKPKDSYKLNEMVKISGKVTAYSGYSIDNATVKYRIIRTASYPYRRWWDYITPRANQQEIAQGQVITDKDGNYTFEFKALSDYRDDKIQAEYNYKITIDATDINGETHTATSTIRIGNISMYINLDISEEICIDKTNNQFRLTTTNLSGNPQAAELHYKIVALETPASYLYERKTPNPTVQLLDENLLRKTFPYLELKDENSKDKWKELEVKSSGTLRTPTDSLLIIPNLRLYDEGYYKIIITSRDIYNQEVELDKIIFLYKENSNYCKAYEPIWLNVDKVTAEPGDKIKIQVGSYLQNAWVWFEIISNDTVLKSEWLKLDKGRLTYQFEVKEEYRGNLIFNTYLGNSNYIYSQSASVAIPFTNKKLDYEFITFRDNLLPGEQEEWKIKVKGYKGEKLASELLCSMYDASLDLFKSNRFYFNVDYLKKNPFNFNLRNNSNYLSSNYYLINDLNLTFENRIYYNLDWIIGHYGYYFGMRGGASRGDYAVQESFDEMSTTINAVSKSHEEMSPKVNANSKSYKWDNVEYDIVSDSEEVGVEQTTRQQPQIRSNFAETAFFFPQLKTDAEGNILFSFTMPESLTKWKFQGVAHTKDLSIGTFEKFVQTRKELMVVPNAPRFFREGDTLYFSAKVVNLGENSLTGNVKIEFFNAINNQPLNILLDGENVPFNVAKGNSQQVLFNMAIPMGISAITYRIIATAGIMSDGEEKIIPVLPNRMMVTESMPLYINGNQSKTFVFEKMKNNNSSTLQNFKYTLEFTANPVWYAIQALPYMMEYPYECNEQVFSRMYANAIAAHIVNSSPKIKSVFDSWLNESSDAFCSNLEKNQELKNIILEETPWVMDAQNESVNKQKVALLFDIRRMARESKEAINKLEKRQSSSGGWPWFSGGRDSWYITQHIVCGFGHLQTLGIDISLGNNSLRKAVGFIDDQITYNYNELKKIKNINMNDNHLNYMAIHYLYARNFYLKKYTISASTQEAYQYYLGQAKKYWTTQSIYSQAMIALALYRAGDETTSKKIMAEIKGRAQYSDEMGMYWKKEGYGWFWYEAPIERQAMLIEAFDVVMQDEISVEKMQQWLLKQKQTQNWGTTKATAEACYALLLRGTNLLEVDPAVSISVGNNIIDVSKMSDTEAGTGYFKTSWKELEINDTMATIVINKPTKGIAWGGVYWQYFENLENITPAQTPLSIQRQLYKVTLNERGEMLTAITDANPLKVGDKVRVRVEIRVDRDMEYVHLKDMRAGTFEPVNVFSQYKYQDKLWYYESTGDAATNFFFDYLPKGVYVLEYNLIASQSGRFSNGISTIQCMYAPEFSAHSGGVIVKVMPK